MSKIIPQFRGEIIRGEFIPEMIDEYDIWVGNLEGKICTLTVCEEKHTRTSSQNKYYWKAIVGLVGDTLGYDKDEMHEIFSSKFLKRTIEINGERMIIIKSTTSLSTEEMSEYIEKCKRFASVELGIIIPDKI